MKRSGLSIAAVLASSLALSACMQTTVTGSREHLTVTSTATACTVSAAGATSGPVSFTVTNADDSVTEFYILADDAIRIVGEVENIGPGLSRDLVVTLQPGTYFTQCKPGMVGDGVGRAEFTVTGNAATLNENTSEALGAALTSYTAYVKDQVEQLVTATDEFAKAYTTGNDDAARALYPRARAHYERIETVAESFGTIDPLLDLREADLAEGEEWTGWHVLEKDLWAPEHATKRLSPDERARYASTLTRDTRALYDAVHDRSFSLTLDAISNGAVGLMDEVAATKVTGEEEIWSRTDLWDFAANLDGARIAYDVVRDLLSLRDANLVERLDTQFASLTGHLAQFGSLADGFVLYNVLSVENVRELSDRVNALSEPLSLITSRLAGQP